VNQFNPFSRNDAASSAQGLTIFPLCTHRPSNPWISILGSSALKPQLRWLRQSMMEKKPLCLQEAISNVRDFHDAFGIKNNSTPTVDLSESDIKLRFELIREENEEYLEAAQNGDLVEVADALGDILYILCGTMLKHGLQDRMEDVFREIQRSNMSKLGADGKPIYREDGKVMKGPNYFRPNIAQFLDLEKAEV
jgi:predicted HAD superfamily Cof-like phosphohydrolase